MSAVLATDPASEPGMDLVERGQHTDGRAEIQTEVAGGSRRLGCRGSIALDPFQRVVKKLKSNLKTLESAARQQHSQQQADGLRQPVNYFGYSLTVVGASGVQRACLTGGGFKDTPAMREFCKLQHLQLFFRQAAEVYTTGSDSLRQQIRQSLQGAAEAAGLQDDLCALLNMTPDALDRLAGGPAEPAVASHPPASEAGEQTCPSVHSAAPGGLAAAEILVQAGRPARSPLAASPLAIQLTEPVRVISEAPPVHARVQAENGPQPRAQTQGRQTPYTLWQRLARSGLQDFRAANDTVDWATMCGDRPGSVHVLTGSQYSHCKVIGDRERCALGGRCKEIRERTGWPRLLPCVDLNSHSPTTAIHQGLCQFFVEKGVITQAEYDDTVLLTSRPRRERRVVLRGTQPGSRLMARRTTAAPGDCLEDRARQGTFRAPQTRQSDAPGTAQGLMQQPTVHEGSTGHSGRHHTTHSCHVPVGSALSARLPMLFQSISGKCFTNRRYHGSHMSWAGPLRIVAEPAALERLSTPRPQQGAPTPSPSLLAGLLPPSGSSGGIATAAAAAPWLTPDFSPRALRYTPTLGTGSTPASAERIAGAPATAEAGASWFSPDLLPRASLNMLTLGAGMIPASMEGAGRASVRDNEATTAWAARVSAASSAPTNSHLQGIGHADTAQASQARQGRSLLPQQP